MASRARSEDRWGLGRVMAIVGLVVTLWAAVGIPARATYGARTTADEPQYLLTALSLAEDGDLDIADEIDDRRFEPFHEISLNPQTEPLAGGREISPHDPGLPLLLAPAMALPDELGWRAAKATLALLAGALAASLVWVAARRFGVAPATAGWVVLAFAASPPLVAYGTQVYPELPAALAVTAAVGLATSRLAPHHLAGLVLTLSGLVWLGVKYAPVSAALAVVVAARLWSEQRRRALGWTVVALVGSGLAYLVAHRLWYGGWTVYATGDHFTATGELSVVGTDPNYLGRTRRVVGLLVDRHFGLVAWAPVFLIVPVAFGDLLRRRPQGWPVLVAPLAAGWATATWVALTMHGWWWPGRQVVVVVPCAVLAVALTAGRRPRAVAVVVALGVAGMALWGQNLAQVLGGERTLVVDVADPAGSVARQWRALLPEGLRAGPRDDWLAALWALGVVTLAALGWNRADTAGDRPTSPVGRAGRGVGRGA